MTEGERSKSLKRWLPRIIREPISDIKWWWINRGQHTVAAAISPLRRRSVGRIKSFKDVHKGQRCFILGNGPSLRATNLDLLKEEITFGLNRIYLNFPSMGYPTSYYVAVNTLVIEQCAGEIQSLSMPKFVTWRGRNWFPPSADVIYLDTDYTPPKTFSTDVAKRVFEGSTVTYVALQLAYYMGFSKAILVGVDHSFSTTGPANATVVSTGADENHFSSDYFGEGFRWQLPDLKASEEAYQLAKQTFEADGREVVDATIGGQLNIFPKVDYESIFA